MTVNPLGTILTVLVKGAMAGFCAGLVFRALEKGNKTVAVVASAITAPVVNTGLFLVGCLLFFMPTINEWAAGAGFASAGKFMIFGLVGGNFLFEVLFNIILSPVILRLINIGRKGKEA